MLKLFQFLSRSEAKSFCEINFKNSTYKYFLNMYIIENYSKTNFYIDSLTFSTLSLSLSVSLPLCFSLSLYLSVLSL